MRQDELMHYGVLGMKWGVRKDPQRHARIYKSAKAAVKKQPSFAKDSRISVVTQMELDDKNGDVQVLGKEVSNLRNKKLVEIRDEMNETARKEIKEAIKDPNTIKAIANDMVWELGYDDKKKRFMVDDYDLLDSVMRECGVNVIGQKLQKTSKLFDQYKKETIRLNEENEKIADDIIKEYGNQQIPGSSLRMKEIVQTILNDETLTYSWDNRGIEDEDTKSWYTQEIEAQIWTNFEPKDFEKVLANK